MSNLEQETSIFWFRRDLRIEDNAGLYHALKESLPVTPIFIFDSNILDELEDRSDKRVSFIYDQVQDLKSKLEEHGSTLLIFHGTPEEVFEEIVAQRKIKEVFTNHDYEPYAARRDGGIAKFLENNGSKLSTFKDQVIFEKDEVLKDDGNPYTVFTPYMRKWKAKLNSFYTKPYPVEKYLSNFCQMKAASSMTIEELGFKYSGDEFFPSQQLHEPTIRNYDKTRDIPSIEGTSRLSVHLRFGTVSIRSLVRNAQHLNEKWLNELIWRDFYMMILWHFPHVVKRAFKSKYDRIQWRNNEREFKAWCNGETGYPIVDAGMRELNETGFMHNRVRMVVASFLCKHLLIDWRWGEAYFAEKLLDFELSSNNGGWQWAAGSGCDAAPYFRVFNPELQTKKFDPDLKYISQWVPEFQELTYVKPIVDHKMARERALSTYKAGLAKG